MIQKKYLREINHFPFLEFREEIGLAKAIGFGEQAKQQDNDNPERKQALLSSEAARKIL